MGEGGMGGRRRLTSDPADRLILSFQRPPLSLLFSSLKECKGWGGGRKKREQAWKMKVVPGGRGDGGRTGRARGGVINK